MKCLGCGLNVDWIKGWGIVAYTCPCGSRIFYDEGHLAIPASFIIRLVEGEPLPHIDYYVGKSAHWSQEKEDFIDMLKGFGAIWSWECPECRERVLQRTRMELENNLYQLPLHPDLQRLVEDVPVPEGYENPLKGGG